MGDSRSAPESRVAEPNGWDRLAGMARVVEAARAVVGNDALLDLTLAPSERVRLTQVYAESVMLLGERIVALDALSTESGNRTTHEHTDDCYSWIAGDCTCPAACPPPESSQ